MASNRYDTRFAALRRDPKEFQQVERKAKPNQGADFMRFLGDIAPTAGSLVGGAIGAGVGSMAGGVGAIPGAGLGATLGGGAGSLLGAGLHGGSDAMTADEEKAQAENQMRNDDKEQRRQELLAVLQGLRR